MPPKIRWPAPVERCRPDLLGAEKSAVRNYDGQARMERGGEMFSLPRFLLGPKGQ